MARSAVYGPVKDFRSPLPSSPHRTLADTARTVVRHVTARVPGFDVNAARRNAWEAVCADQERRRQWEEAA
ncbi:hypothetical protein [Actinopolymorpha alba]|uniref:hypothetical protein n=1 Tax=Actinopolymorpha alba TaxID=533267 RepID=UPI000369DCBC|nr:hypothetical protein [Actinopolymorpha alba]